MTRGRSRLEAAPRCLPRATREAWSRADGDRTELNLGLEFHRFAERGAGRKRTKQFVRNLVKSTQNPNKEGYAAFFCRWRESVGAWGGEPFELRQRSRMFLGYGTKSSLDGLMLERVYGCPIIPGSALKGVARIAALHAVAEAACLNRPPEKEDSSPSRLEMLAECLAADDAGEACRALQEKAPKVNLAGSKALRETFRRVFGTTSSAGQALFFDAVAAEWADEWSKLELLLTVGGTTFAFAVGWRGAAGSESHRQAVNWLKSGLFQLGVGAKTAAGCGLFDEVCRTAPE